MVLDVISASLATVAGSRAELERLIQSGAYNDQWLMVDLADLLQAQGLSLAEGECYGCKIAPVIGGELGVSNMEVTTLAVYHAVMSQIHEQVKDWPVGTKITGVTVDGKKP